MSGIFERLSGGERSLPWSIPAVWGVAILVATYLGAVLLPSSFPADGIVRTLIGPVLALLLPGALLVSVIDVGTESFGRFVLFAVGTGLALLALVTTLLGVSLPPLGVRRPLSVLPLALAVSAVVVALAAIAHFGRVRVPTVGGGLADPPPVVYLLVSLPVVAVNGALTMNVRQLNAGMYLFVGLVLVVVLLSATRHVPRSLYPAVVFSLSISALLHRNLLTDQVVGADVQLLYAVSRHVLAVGSWSPDVAGSAASIPVVSTVPAVLSLLSGVPVATTFKVLYVFVFSLVPVGVYYVGRDVFDADVAFYGALFFLFYHASFFFTPGKQLVSELFVVLSLLAIWSDAPRAGRVLAVGLLSAGLVGSHYGMTYVFGIAFLAAAVGLAVGRRLSYRFRPTLPVGYPVLLLAGATAWYAYASPSLAAKLASIPQRVAGQAIELLLYGTIPGSGASYVSGGTTVVETLQLALYVLLTGLLAIGLGWRALAHLARLRSGAEPGRVDHTMLALPMFAFLGASYVLVFDLWADRAYQLALTVLAPFAAYGFGRASRWVAERRGDVSTADYRPRWLLLAILLGALFAFNSGAVAATVGTPRTSTFDAGAHDLVFSDDERAAVTWIKRQPGVVPTETTNPSLGARHTVDAPERVQIYTDSVSAQLFRAFLPEQFYSVEVVELKNRWQPTLDRSRIGEGYVFIRRASVARTPADRPPPSYLTREEVAQLEAAGDVVYENEDAVVLKVSEGSES